MPSIKPEPTECQATHALQPFALENLAQPPKQEAKSSTRNFTRAVKKALQALRRFEPLPEAVRLIADLLLEYSYASARTYAYVKQAKTFCILLRKDKSEISRSLDWMEEKRIIVRAGGYYSFHSGLFLRLTQKQSADLAELELALENPKCQPFFPREPNLNDEHVEGNLARVEPRSTPATAVEPGSTRVAAVESGSTAQRGVPKQRSTLTAEGKAVARRAPAVEPGSTRSQLAAASYEKSTEVKLAAASPGITAEDALTWLMDLDQAGELKQRGSGLFAAEWLKLCQTDPGCVLTVLRPALLRRMQTKGVSRPIAWMAVKARAMGKFELRSSP